MNRLRRNDIILISSCAIIAAIIFISGIISENKMSGTPMLEITVDGRVFGTYPLDEDRDITIGSTNRCRIKDGSVTMTKSTCHNQTCVHSKAIDGKKGGSIVCLPNRIVLKIVSSGSTMGGYDSIAE